MTKKIFLIRHGETEWSLNKRHTGFSDIPLTENGIKQASLLAKELQNVDLKKVWVSPLIRAKETFKLSNLPITPILDSDLKEWNYGDYEGITSEKIHETEPDWNIFTHGAPNGESIAEIETRALRMLDKTKNIDGDVAFFSSGHILRVIAAKWLEMPVEFGKHLFLQTASLSILGYEHENRALLLWNKVV